MSRYQHTSESIWYKIIHYGLEFIGKYYSTYRAFVVDNNDPEGLNRVRVVLPQFISNDTKGTWAFPKGQWGGNNYGVNLLPKKGDMVFVEFEQGNLDYPIWQFASYGEKEKPEEFNSPNIFGFKTPKGNIVTINDGESDDDWDINIKTKTGNEYILIAKDKTTIDSKEIILGSKGEYRAVKGEVNNDNLEAICEKITDLVNLFISHTHPSDSTPANNVAQAANLALEIETLKTEFEKSLSDKVKLD